MKKAVYVPFNNDYVASADGRVISLKHGKQKELRQSYGSNGYMNVALSKDGISCTWLVHRLIAICHVNNPDPKKFNIVNHIDGNKMNNAASNLEWTDHRGNAIHASKLPRKAKAASKIEVTDDMANSVLKFLFDEIDYDTFMKVAAKVKTV